MSSPFYALISLILAVGTISCQNANTNTELTPGAGYSKRDAYNRGHSDGSSDRRGARASNPHIQSDADLPSAYRLQYMWGYNEGYKNPYSRSSGSK